ncbi:GNAT family N-acetyltransferase [Flavobacterium silvaticum]|uniref:N-acetyltransferase n=1 Tax=Flavobacterium silvaticum TaxID=1852020 RepID=A0A972FK02_9FLAO|nr:GNAT family N-acetyltransferase [Flavobacterium silvaticum]NMH27092.1 N-acetyltransferase [Flavobacterium silvaticum]
MQFSDNTAEHQFELDLGTDKAILEYAISGNKIHLTHTEVPKPYRGNGVAAELTKKALQYIRSKNLELVPLCPYTQYYVNNHSEFHDLLSDGYQM